MNTLRSLPLFVLLTLGGMTGCGFSDERLQPQPAHEIVDAGPPDPEPTPKRTLIERSLLPGAPQNMLLDVTFRDQGWGHFTSFVSGGMSQPTIVSRISSLSPAGVTAPVAAFDAKTKGVTSIASFLGGPGPFVARVWISASNATNDPILLEADNAVFRCAITTGGLPEGKAYDLARKDEMIVGARTWVLFEGRVDEGLPGTAFFNLKFGKTGGGFLVQAPEVVPQKLLPAGDSTKSFSLPNKARALLPEEWEAIAFYKRQPVQLGLPKLPKLVPESFIPRSRLRRIPGVKTPLAD